MFGRLYYVGRAPSYGTIKDMCPAAHRSVVNGRQARRGRVFIVAAPSGAGKTSLLKKLLEELQNLRLSVSHTTRPRRGDEVEGRDYHFVDEATFSRLRENGDFLESAKVFGHRYGTSRRRLEREIESGYDIVLEIDWQGARQIRERLDNVCSIFILPPSEQALRKRLQNRNRDSREVIERRMSEAMKEMSHFDEFDRVVVNDDFERARADLRRIVTGRPLTAVSRERVAQAVRSLGLAGAG